MSNFEKIFNRSLHFHSGDRAVSPKLRGLLEQFYCNLIIRPINQILIKESMISLLSFLTTPEGRTDANVRTVDLFVCIDDDWERKWSELPQSFVDILSDIGGGLHDTIASPDIAKMCEATPEQLLERAEGLS